MFFTENSAGISYRELSYIINYREHLEFIKCAKGTNALDFQLVSYVGYLMKTGAKTKYIIVSNDHGFDAILNFWYERDRDIIRLSSNDILENKLNSKNEMYVDNLERDNIIGDINDKKDNIFDEINNENDIKWIKQMLDVYDNSQRQKIHNELTQKFGLIIGSDYYRIIKSKLKEYYDLKEKILI